MDTLNTTFDFTAADADGVVFASQRVRVIILDGAPWFVLADVGAALGLAPHPRGGYSNHLRVVADDERRTLKKAHHPDMGALFPGRTSAVAVISESALYKLVMRSDKPAARPFQEWVTREVLPAIRRTGGFRLAGVAPEAVEEGTVAEMHKSCGPRSPMQTASISRPSLKRDDYVTSAVTQASAPNGI